METHLVDAQLVTLPRRRWDFWSIGLGTVIVQLLSQASSAYFLHFDTSTQDVAALEWVRGCWAYSTSKILPIILLGPFYKLFGPSQYWETFLLLVGAALSVAAVYELARLISGRFTTGLLAALLLVALPAFQYFSRTHLGYPMPFLLLGWLAAFHKRWNWTGLCFGLAIAAHYNSWVPVGLAFVALAIFYLRFTTWKQWLGMMICFAIPLLAMDVLYFLYTGIPFQWNIGVFSEVFRLSQVAVGSPHPDWLWLVRTVVISNGLVVSLLLALNLAAPIVTWPNKTGVALLGTFIGLAALYMVQGGMGRALLVSRILASSYPFWAIGAALLVSGLIEKLKTPTWKQGFTVALMLGLAISIFQITFFIRGFTETLYPIVEQTMARAAVEGRPVRYVGNYWIPAFYGQIYRVEVLSGDYRWLEAQTPGQAVLIFEGQSPLEFDRTNYEVQSYEISNLYDQTYLGLTEEAGISRRLEIWWPAQPSQPIGPLSDLPPYSIYFSGSGCITPPTYGHGTLHFYQLVAQKILEKLSVK